MEWLQWLAVQSGGLTCGAFPCSLGWSSKTPRELVAKFKKNTKAEIRQQRRCELKMKTQRQKIENDIKVANNKKDQVAARSLQQELRYAKKAIVKQAQIIVQLQGLEQELAHTLASVRLFKTLQASAEIGVKLTSLYKLGPTRELAKRYAQEMFKAGLVADEMDALLSDKDDDDEEGEESDLEKEEDKLVDAFIAKNFPAVIHRNPDNDDDDDESVEEMTAPQQLQMVVL